VIKDRGLDPQFFIISEGQVRIEHTPEEHPLLTALEDSGEGKEAGILGPSQYFGEEIITTQKTASRAVAVGNVIVFQVSQKGFDEYLGVLHDNIVHILLAREHKKAAKSGKLAVRVSELHVSKPS
jgi:CRP-like cAMP-binding protein